jgi:glyoxylase-like metal-dependent hydrolase (beta-lactamase superfamily II)/8-oxo-dGTP pyrophosphatase MutT (NUDIX family)
MKKILDAASIVITCGEEIFAIQRQNYLKAFPGYWAFPGGKVEADDENFFIQHDLTRDLDPKIFGAAVREGQEELGFDLREEIRAGRVERIDHLGLAITPDFNPFRFATYFFRFHFKVKPKLEVDRNEARLAKWMSSQDLLKQFSSGFVLAVPPVIKIIETLGTNPHVKNIPDLNFAYDSEKFVPCIESLKGIRQLMPLSHTLPPATRTNAFLIGDDGEAKILVDPSPIDDAEYERFKHTLNLFGVDKIMLTHHHPDHHERSTDLAREYNVPILLSTDTFDRLLKKKPDYFNGIKTHFLREGDVVTKWLTREVVVYEVPGHDEGQLALAASDMSWLIAGDLFQGVGTVVIGGEEGDMAKYFATLEKVIQLAPKVLFPSHGIGLGGTSILERTLEHRRVRENQILTMHKEGLNVEQMLETIYADVQKELWPYARENINKHLVKLKNEKRI